MRQAWPAIKRSFFWSTRPCLGWYLTHFISSPRIVCPPTIVFVRTAAISNSLNRGAGCLKIAGPAAMSRQVGANGSSVPFASRQPSLLLHHRQRCRRQVRVADHLEFAPLVFLAVTGRIFRPTRQVETKPRTFTSSVE